MKKKVTQNTNTARREVLHADGNVLLQKRPAEEIL